LTEEQLIVLGVLAAAFVAGWALRALIARLELKRERAREQEQLAGPELDEFEERLDRAVEESRLELDRAIRTYLSTVAFSAGAREGGRPPAPLGEHVTAALQDDVANEAMTSAVPQEAEAVSSERELDVMDWGFAYGVAWARARQRDPTAPADLVAAEALRAAREVFGEYAADAGWTPPESAHLGNGEPGWLRSSGRAPR
jgi:hypothetical protein